MYITILLTGSRIGDIGGYAFREVLEEGIGEHEVALHTTRAMVREIASTYPQTDIMDSKSKFCFFKRHPSAIITAMECKLITDMSI